MKKQILAFTMVAGLSFSGVACDKEDARDVQEFGEDVEKGVEDVGEDVEKSFDEDVDTDGKDD